MGQTPLPQENMRRRTPHPHSAVSRRTALILAGILLVGAVPRLLYLREIRENPDFDHPAIDAGYHHHWARGIAVGNWETPEGRDDPQIYLHPFYRPPGYAYFLAGIYRVCGVGFLAPRLAQMLLGLLAAALAFFIGRRWFGETAGLIWSGLMAVYWIFIFYEGELAGESVAVFLALPLIWSVAAAGEERGWARGLLAGVLLGLFALFRANVLAFFPAAAGWIVWARRRHAAKTAWLTVAGFALGTALAISPATIRNAVVSGEFVPIAATAGISVAVANNELTDGTTHFIPGIGDVGTPYDWPRIVRHLEKTLGRPLGHAEASDYLVGLGKKFMFARPGKFLKLLGRKALLFWGPYEIRNLKETHYARLNSPVLRAIPLNFTLVFALGVLGAILFFARRRLGRGDATAGCSVAPPGAAGNCLSPSHQFEIGVLLVLFIVFYFLSMVAFAAADRYRIPLIPFLLLFGSLGVERMAAFARGREWGKAGLAAAGGIALFGLFSLNPTGYRPSPEKWHYDRALAYVDDEDWENAVREALRAIDYVPGYGEAYATMGVAHQKAGRIKEAIAAYETSLKIKPSARTEKNLADALLQAGRDAEGKEHYRRALELDPAFGRIYCDLAQALSDRGEKAAAIEELRKAIRAQPDNAAAHNLLATILLETGGTEEALGHYREAIRINPRYAVARYNLGNLLSRSGKLSAAAAEFEAAVRIKPDYTDALNNLGVALTMLGRFDEAFDRFRQAQSVAPADPAAWFNMGIARARRGENAEAERCFGKVLELAPDYAPAKDALKMMRAGR
jgi:tetratricopeptide (TPR) repeat protein